MTSKCEVWDINSNFAVDEKGNGVCAKVGRTMSRTKEVVYIKLCDVLWVSVTEQMLLQDVYVLRVSCCFSSTALFPDDNTFFF